MEKVTSSDGIVFPKLVDLRNETDCVAAYVLSCKGCEMNAGIGKNSEVAKYDSVVSFKENKYKFRDKNLIFYLGNQ